MKNERVRPEAVGFYRRHFRAPGRVSEPDAEAYETPPDERSLQCVWADDAWRPQGLQTALGEPVTVVHPGRWNLEAGPDFRNAVVRVGREQRRIEGDVEVHIRPADWKTHGHAGDPRYREVRFHVSYFDDPLPPDLLPPGALQIALRKPLRADPVFSFEQIDTLAYPYRARGHETPCRKVLGTWRPAAQCDLFRAAGIERLRRKALRMQAAIRNEGPGQALYAALLQALGYKNNKRPMRSIALALPLARLREAADGDAIAAYACLCGSAGLLPAEPLPEWDEATHRFHAHLWGIWWRERSRVGSADPPAWRWEGMRPLNHPLRRLAAAADLFTRRPAIEEQMGDTAEAPRTQIRVWRALLTGLALPYWSGRLRFGVPDGRTATLVGPTRASALINNVLAPFALARASACEPSDDWASALPAEGRQSTAEAALYALLGPDVNPRLYRAGVVQQGLLQIFYDYCLADRSGCRDCPLPAQIEATRFID